MKHGARRSPRLPPARRLSSTLEQPQERWISPSSLRTSACRNVLASRHPARSAPCLFTSLPTSPRARLLAKVTLSLTAYAPPPAGENSNTSRTGPQDLRPRTAFVQGHFLGLVSPILRAWMFHQPIKRRRMQTFQGQLPKLACLYQSNNLPHGCPWTPSSQRMASAMAFAWRCMASALAASIITLASASVPE